MRSSAALARQLAPHLLAIVTVFLVTGVTIATVPVFVSQELKLGPAVVGGISGAQFAAALASRLAAGQFADRRGPKAAVILGLGLAALGGLISYGAFGLRSSTGAAATVLVVGRAAVGGAESLIIVGAQTWALALAGPARAAQVIGWAGMALFTALALGAPLGSGIYADDGFEGVCLFTVIVPIAAFAIVIRLAPVPGAPGQPLMFAAVLKRVYRLGISVALAGCCYGAMTSFGVLLFRDRGWTPHWAALALFSAALILARVTIGSMPDRLGATRSVLILLSVQVTGLSLLALTRQRVVAFLAAFAVGFGYSVVYPALAREAVHRVAPQNRGAAVAVFSAFLDLTLACATPLMGQIAAIFGTPAVFLFCAATAAASMVMLALSQDRSKP